jgi:hypothetical protein
VRNQALGAAISCGRAEPVEGARSGPARAGLTGNWISTGTFQLVVEGGEISAGCNSGRAHGTV